MTKRKRTGPDKFERLPIDLRPVVDDETATAAVQRFVTAFVIASKRDRMVTMLLNKEREKRAEAIQTVYKWVEPKRKTELVGSTGFPQHLKTRFGEILGILIDQASARRSSIAEAAVLAAGGFGAIFIADIQPVALLLPEVGPPTLCSW